MWGFGTKSNFCQQDRKLDSHIDLFESQGTVLSIETAGCQKGRGKATAISGVR